MTQLLISSDSHAQVSHDAVKAHLATRFHDEYDGAVAAFQQRMAKGAGRANQAWQSDRKRDEAASSFRLRNMTRPGHSDGVARLADMDTDGVQQEVIYSEVSAFRYIRDLQVGQSEATVAFNEALREFGAADPSRLIVSYQIPIHDVDAAVAEVRRVAALGAKSLQLPVFPPEVGLPDYYHERYDPLFSLIQETGLPICCHIGLNTMLDDLVARDPTPGSAVMVPMAALTTGEALGMWIMGGVFERFPESEGRVRRARARAGSRGGCSSPTTWSRARATSSPRSPSCRASTSTATCSSRSSTRPTPSPRRSCATGSASRT